MPPTETPPPRRGLIVLALGVVLFMSALDQTVVGTALPRIAAELGGMRWYAWVFTAYLLATTAVVPIAGKLGDVYGRRPLLIIGIVEFVISSLIAGLAPSMEILVLMRALQGVGAGIVVASAQAALGDLFPPAELGKYNGMMSGVYALASLVGPVLGGAITDAVGWRWTFLINLPVGLFALLVVLRRFKPARPSADRRAPLDLAGATLLVLAVTAALGAFGGLERGLEAWLPTAAAGVAALVLGGLFFMVERRAESPIIPLPLIAKRELRVILMITFCTGLGLYGASIFTPLLLQGALGMSPSGAGLAMTPMVFSLVAGGVVGGLIISRRGRYKGLLGIGSTIAAIAAALLATHAGRDPTVVITATWLALVGLGVGVTIPALISAAQNSVSYAELGLATSLSKFARTFGGIVGLGILGSVLHLSMAARLRERLPTLLGRSDDALAEALALDPSALLEADSDALLRDHPSLAGDVEQLPSLLDLLSATLAESTATLLWGVAAALFVGALLTLRLSGHALRRSFEEPTADETQ